jgi:hypothetical protein
VTNNGGGYVCLGQFLHQVSRHHTTPSAHAQSVIPVSRRHEGRPIPVGFQILKVYSFYPNILRSGFQSSMRDTTLAQEIVASQIKLGNSGGYYYPTNWQYLNDTTFPATYNYMEYVCFSPVSASLTIWCRPPAP